MKEEPLISIVLGSFNQKEKLSRVIDSFKKQSLDPHLFELIIADSSSSDGTQELIAHASLPCHFQGLILENNGKAAARNRGIEAAKGDIILITDADMIADSDLVKTHLEAHQNASKPCSFEGVTLNMSSYDWPPKENTLSPYIRKNYGDGASLGWWYFLTGNISFPKSLINVCGMFDEEFDGYGWEDLELGYRFFKKKIPHFYLKKAINYHYHVISDTDEIDRGIAKGRSARTFLKKHPELKWFLGLNPLSVWVYGLIKGKQSVYNWLHAGMSASSGIRRRVSFWALSELNYLSGILSEE